MKIVRSEQKIPFEAKDGSEIRELLRSESERMSLAEATVREETKLHFHKTSDEIYYILEGRGVMEIEGERREVSEGDAVFIPSKKKHRIYSDKNEKVRFLCICAPPYSDEDTVMV